MGKTRFSPEGGRFSAALRKWRREPSSGAYAPKGNLAFHRARIFSCRTFNREPRIIEVGLFRYHQLEFERSPSARSRKASSRRFKWSENEQARLISLSEANDRTSSLTIVPACFTNSSIKGAAVLL